MMNAFLLALAIAFSSELPGTQTIEDYNRVFHLSGPTPYTDGKTRGASISGLGLALGKTIEYYQYSGRTLCMSSSATRQEPDDAGYGWHVAITPIGTTGGLQLEVAWQRRWERGVAVKGTRSSSRVTLQPGDKVMLDYIPAGMATPRCEAIGMGLQIELGGLASLSSPIIEADVWLVRKRDNTTLERQTLRMQQGEGAAFFFKDAGVTAFQRPSNDGRGKEFFFFNQESVLTARISGRIMPVMRGDGTFEVTFELNQNLDGQSAVAWRPDALQANPLAQFKPGGATQGGATSRFTAGPGEVVELQAPRLSSPFGSPVEQFVVRVQVRPMVR